MDEHRQRLWRIAVALKQRGFPEWGESWSMVHDAAHALDLRLTEAERTPAHVGDLLTAMSTPDLVRAECLALAVGLLIHKCRLLRGAESKCARELWKALAPSKRPPEFRNRANRRPSVEALRCRIRRAKRSAYARTLVAMFRQMGTMVYCLPPVTLPVDAEIDRAP